MAAVPGSRDLRLETGSSAIDMGEELPNLNKIFAVQGSPDAGALELGQSLPHVGPRPFGWIWGDGFESLSTARWAATVP